MISDTNYKYDDCFVAFLDILGFSERISQTINDNNLLETLINTLKINRYFTQVGGKQVQNENEKRIIETRSYFFSDSFVFIMKAKKEDLPHLFLIIRYLQDRLWESNLCLRGALNLGKMYWAKKDENILLGPAMIAAYNLESVNAIYPRIIISEELKEFINSENIKAWPIAKNSKRLNEFIIKDKDGLHFFDILNSEIIRKKEEKIIPNNSKFSISWSDDMDDSFNCVLENVKKTTQQEITNKNEKIKQKYEWLKSYLEKK